MKWIAQDIDTYLNAKEYIDTAIVPLYSLSLGNEMKQSAEMGEFISLLSAHLERQFTGRVLLFPPFTYLKNDFSEKVINELNKWEDYIIQSEFKYVFYLTSESDWKLYEGGMTGTVLWLPALPLKEMTDSQKMSVIDSQVKQLMNLFTQKWNGQS